jgi:hypothetical protein
VVRRHRRHVLNPPAACAAVWVVAGGDTVTVFDNPDSADIMEMVMVGANLDTMKRVMTPTRWETVRAELATHQPRLTIVDSRPGRSCGAS